MVQKTRWLLLALSVAHIGAGNRPQTDPKTDPWAAVRDADKPVIAQGWSQPVRLEVSGSGRYWGDSLWVTPDGTQIYFMVYDGDAMTDVMIKKAPKDDPDIYVSDAPFHTKRKVDRFELSRQYIGDAGPMIDDQGDFWYMSNRKYLVDRSLDTDIYRNKDRLPFNTNAQEGNPHYCVAKD